MRLHAKSPERTRNGWRGEPLPETFIHDVLDRLALPVRFPLNQWGGVGIQRRCGPHRGIMTPAGPSVQACPPNSDRPACGGSEALEVGRHAAMGVVPRSVGGAVERP